MTEPPGAGLRGLADQGLWGDASGAMWCGGQGRECPVGGVAERGVGEASRVGLESDGLSGEHGAVVLEPLLFSCMNKERGSQREGRPGMGREVREWRRWTESGGGGE